MALFKDIQATILVDVERTEQEIWEGLDRSRRKNVNKAKENDLIFRQGTPDDFSEFYKIYSIVWRNGGIESDNYKEVFDRLEKGYEFYVCIKKGMIIGGAMIVENEPRTWKFSIVACDPVYNDIRPNDFMYWNLIMLIKNKGAKFADLGGWQINAFGHLLNVNAFKEKWGGKITYYNIESNNPAYIIGRKIYRNSLLIRSIINKIKGRKETSFEPKNG